MLFARSPLRRAHLDSAVAAFEARIAPLMQPEPEDPQGRRRVAQENDTRMCAELGITPLDTATEDRIVPVDGHPDVRVRVYWPEVRRAEPGADLPIVVSYYGGGFTIGGIDWVSWDARFRRRAHDAGVIVVAADYGRSPEVRYPAQPEQCWAALEWAARHARELGGSAGRLAIGGTSSGGNLAAAVTLLNRERGQLPIRLQILENPALDLTIGHADAGGLNRSVPGVLVRRIGRMLVRQYVGPDPLVAREPFASPLLASSFEGLPPAWICTCELDPLRGDGEAYARALSAAGVPVTVVRFVGQTHTSLGWTDFIPAADAAHRAIIAELRTLHDLPTDDSGLHAVDGMDLDTVADDAVS